MIFEARRRRFLAEINVIPLVDVMLVLLVIFMVTNTTGNITPFIGLLGTVVGIINAFTEIGRQGTASLAAVAPGVAEALVATAAGLFTAIPAVIAYNYFLTRIRNSAFHMEAFSIELLNALLVRMKQVGVRG